MKAILFLGLAGLCACADGGARRDVVARVGESALTAAELEGLLPPGAGEEERRRALEGWIDRELLYQEALARRLHEDARLRRQLERTRRDLLLAALLDDEFGRGEIRLDEAEIRQYYDAHPGEFQRSEPEVRARHILLSSRREANLRRAALQGGADFAALARQYSQDEDTREQGGDLGYFSPSDEPILWRACEKLEIDRLSRPVRTQYGYHILQVLDRQEAGSLRPLEQVRAQIVETLVWQKQRQRLQQLVETLRETREWALLEAP